ncbi:zinc transporter ZupT [Ruminococcaceae bacterium OttesenSCG-928-N02]|nr:zinc transporter ZupT [Ruminococcaceae bacterium OttesenSCG-928-N02]
MSGNVVIAFAFTLIAGLSTGIGSAIALFTKRANDKFLALSLGFSAGVMIYVSMVEVFAEAQGILRGAHGARLGGLLTVAGFFGGMLLIALIDHFVPGEHNPHEITHTHVQPSGEAGEEAQAQAQTAVQQSHEGAVVQKEHEKKRSLMRTGILTAMAITIHNFPEGMATFISALQAPALAVPIVVAIAIHNIPEGIAVSIPIYYATGDRKKAFFYSFISGMSEPLGALVGYLILMPFMSETLYGIIFAGVAGVMVFISLDELLPSARQYGEHHLSIYGLVAGMMFMALSLLLFI